MVKKDEQKKSVEKFIEKEHIHIHFIESII